MKKYIDIINGEVETSKRSNYSFTCSTKTIEERAIIAYLEYLKDNNLAYGKVLKDVLYNGAVEKFNLSLPLKKSIVSVASKSSDTIESNINSEDVEKILKNTNEIVKNTDLQAKEIVELRKIIEAQNLMIQNLKLINNKELATTNVIAAEEKLIVEVDSEEAKERALKTEKFKNKSSKSMFG